ncbi:hypothetical protein QR680_009707 [Steinernema hermaphroditum]|uniref:Origin recognition complex subunit 5 C-terminal domain-containing protein n=1 Tax=Steinernema hermaphroditum TaxID=289476 RepID=A0AA39INV9_9BILA|nr:hypothetical protein QR680_009707 [Steinernema hermaphroditum]
MPQTTKKPSVRELSATPEKYDFADEYVDRILELLQNPCSSAAHIRVISSSTVAQELLVTRLMARGEFLGDTVMLRKFDCNLLDGCGRVLLRELYHKLEIPQEIDSFETLCDGLDLVGNSKRRVAVFYNADRLRRFPPNVLAMLFAIAEEKYDGFRIVTVGSSKMDYSESFEITSPVNIVIENFAKDDLLDYLTVRCFPSEKSIGRDAIRTMYDTINLHCKEPFDLELVAKQAWGVYLKRGGSTKALDSKLWLDVVKRQLTELFDAPDIEDPNSVRFENMPLLTRYLILASYCASYNPVSSDPRFFTKMSAKQKKTNHPVPDNYKSAHEMGPKNFSMNRLRQMYLFLADSFTTPSDHPERLNIPSQIPNLVTAGVLSRHSAESNLSDPKYCCLISLEAAKSLARSLNAEFDLTTFLFDFASQN